MRTCGLSFALSLALAIACSATALADSAMVAKAGATKVVVTIPVRGAPSSLTGVKTIPDLLSRVDGLSAAEKKRILDAAESGFVTAVRLESDSDGQSSWIEVPTAGAPLSRGESSFKFQAPELEVMTNPGTPNNSAETKRGK